MKNLNMFCISLEPNHYKFIKSLGYIPVGLGDKDFDDLKFDILKNNNNFKFNTIFEINSSPLLLKAINYSKEKNDSSIIRVKGNYLKDNEINLDQILYSENNNSFEILKLKLNKNFKILEKIKPDSVISITGKVLKRTPETINKDLPTGEIEVEFKELEILSEAQELPMPVFGEQDYPEDIRLKYRFLDLRRQTMHENIILRSKVISFIRKKMTELGFNEFQTPILTASSPEGARDFLVPSRLNPGKFYALPQAPQQFKQMIKVAGFDKYFQITKKKLDIYPRIMI